MIEQKELKIGNLLPKIPLIQGGMGVGISLSSLAGTVAKEGAIGVISTAQIGYREEDFDKNPLKANMRAIHKEIERARQIAKDGILGVNIMVATRNYPEYVKEVVRAGIDLIISGAGLPMELPKVVKEEWEELKRVGKEKVFPALVPIVSSKKAANLMLKMWDKKDGIVPDALIYEGPKAGGHLGFLKEQAENMTQEECDEEIKGIVEAVKPYEEKYGREIPIIVAGGVTTKEDMEHYFQLGAKGIQVATPFITTEECDADRRYKEAYLACQKEDIVLVKSPVGMPGRALYNEFQKRLERDGKIPVTHCHTCIAKCNPKEIPYCITDGLVQAVKGNIDEGLLFCGANGYRETKITTVKEVLERYWEL